jgi:acyl-CoA thioester hydrolase
MTSKCVLTVRTYECDHYGHVNNANYLNYLEYARYKYLADIGFDYRAFVAQGCGIFVAKIEIDYKRPAVYGDELLIETTPLKKGAVSGTLAQTVTLDSALVVSAKVTWACVDSKGIPTKLPPQFDMPGLNPAG